MFILIITSIKSIAQDTNHNSGRSNGPAIINSADSKNTVTTDDIVASIREYKLGYDATLLKRTLDQRQQFISTLLNIFRDSRATDDQQCVVACYLGECHAAEAADVLAANITKDLATPRMYFGGPIPSIPGALVQIGAPCIPSLLKNMQESDDANVQKLSLMVLYTIEGDKDVVQLRLQKALDVQQDTTKKARLQAALKSLPEINKWPGMGFY